MEFQLGKMKRSRRYVVVILVVTLHNNVNVFNATKLYT